MTDFNEAYAIQTENTEAIQTMEQIRNVRRDFRDTFLTAHGQRVMQDLVQACRGNKTCFHPDPRVHAMLEGRREILLYIQRNINLTPEELFKMYEGRAFNPEDYGNG